ncbi:hypothetical protein ACJRO7_020302 [Eucalyptus globulus]|uniref:Phosphoribosylglycinamide synthetase ATP-grasp (A) domain-containing protein n=1 Tax=Eucalyptus globulus TaxID=34317 RepID=A0ABD3KL55_EUCGL
MLVVGIFGSACCKVMVEEYPEGEEASFVALVDGENALLLILLKTINELGMGIRGPILVNGWVLSVTYLDSTVSILVLRPIILPTIEGTAVEGCKFVGSLYAGLVIEKKSWMPKLTDLEI